ncbi:DUF3990 domain-containing protein [Butyrivibrio sp. AE3006]|uniref:DUF3990 domain-containing protein n=1 Tax=Butyrivibrio sp. AE3006 TaxID=1280673 RepID=UPI0003F7836E|nr:DUF3990 domain-containing protein [Butyrivibrio sp. AE3006]
MIKVFHAGYELIMRPDLHRGRKNADFGQGFYVTKDYEFATRWAREKSGEDVILNTYELDESGLKIKYLDRDEEWFRYIFSNRRIKPDEFSEYDVIVGPIANDTIFNTLGIMTSGYLSDDEALKLLCVGPMYQQVVLKTLAAVDNLHFVSVSKLLSESIKENKEILAKEEECYLNEVAQVMQGFDQEEK